MSDEKLSIEERIRADVESILITTGRTPKLVYLVSQIDADTLVRGDIAAPDRFQLATSCGMVGVAVDRWCPIGSVHRAYECSCGALFVDDRSRSGKCAVCLHQQMAITMLDADLKAGRLKIEDDHANRRWHVSGVDYGSEPSRSTITTTCARCSATIDPAAVEQHHERCFVVGDAVRWEFPSRSLWVEGSWVGSDDHGFWKEHRIGVTAVSVGWESSDDDDDDTRPPVAGTMRHFGVDNDNTSIRHIQRPGQAVRDDDPVEARAAAYHKLVADAPGPIGCAHGDDDDDELQDAYEAMEEFTPILPPGVDPLDVVYDGIKLRDLLFIDEADRLEISGPRRRARRTDAQRAAVSAHWSQQLRARISAAKERERLQVRIEQDVEDEPWK